MKTLVLLALTFLSVILVGCGAGGAKPDEIVTAATKGWNSDSISATQVDTTLSYFSDDAVFKMVGFPAQIPAEFTGKEAIRAAFESWMPLHPKLQVDVIKVEGNTVAAKTQYWSDTMRSMGVAPLVGTDVYIIKDSKIVSETWTLDNESQTKFASAFATAQVAGVYLITITKDDSATFPDIEAGDYLLKLQPDLRWLVEDQHDPGWVAVEVEGTYTVTADQIVFKTTGGAASGLCTGLARSGTYGWSLGEDTLTLTTINDDCAANKFFFTVHPFARQP